MKIAKIKFVLIRKAVCLFFSFFTVFLFFSCKSTEVTEPETQEIQAKEPEPAPEPEPEPVPVVEEKTPEPEPEPVIEENAPEPEPVVEVQKTEPKDEYERSVGDVSVSRDTFAEDKERILKIISSLDIVMRDIDYKSWLAYVDKDSISYWSKPANLKKAQSRLPVKGLRLTSLEDYFKYVFIPARKGREITEIRYISDSYIKAIEVGEAQDIVYYYFKKIGGYWMVNLPPIED